MKIHRVIVTIYPPRIDDGYPGQVEEGQYLVDDNTVTLVSPAGLTLHDKSGKPFTKTLGNSDEPHKIAGRLLKQYRESKNKGSRFNRPIHYPKTGII